MTFSLHIFSTSNIKEAVIRIEHSKLERASEESMYKSKCPRCESGILLVRRERTMELSEYDSCICCGQRFVYTDIEKLRKLEGTNK